jgi:hypothetical protein
LSCCTRSAHGVSYVFDFVYLSFQSIMGATANNSPFAAGGGAAVFMGWGLAWLGMEVQLEKAGERMQM